MDAFLDGFNSTLVQLNKKAGRSSDNFYQCFNSTLVQLNSHLENIDNKVDVGFQFHIGSIK